MFFKPKDINKSFILQYAPIFSSLGRLHKNLIYNSSQVVHYKKGELIYKQGSPSDAFYCVISGRVRVSRIHDNREDILEFHTVGNYFGIVSLLTTEVHSVSAHAVNDTLLLYIKKSDFDLIMTRVPKLALGLSKTLSEQIKIRDYSRHTAKSNIISVYSAARNIGRTMYAVNLALSLRKETTKKVIFLEISSSGKEIFKILNIEDKSRLLDLTNPLIHKDSVTNFIIKDQSLGIDILNINKPQDTNISAQHISSLFSYLTAQYQYVIIDLPVERNDFTFKALTESDDIHIVTDYQMDNLEATKKLTKDLFKEVEFPQEKIKIVLNTKKDSTKLPSDEVAEMLEHDIYANIPVFWEAKEKIDGSSAKLVLTQPDSEYARAIRRISREIGDMLVGLALGSGAAFGLAHVGVLKVLEREKIPIDIVAGTSMGALVGALWVSGNNAEQVQEIMMHYNRRIDRVIKLLFDFYLSKSSLMKGNMIYSFLKRHIGNKTFQDIKLPFIAVASNLSKMEKVAIDSGSLADAVRTSVAIPVFYAPSISGSDIIVDGGVLEPVPTEVLASRGIKKIIAVNVLPSPQDIEESYKLNKYAIEKEKIDVAKKGLIARFIYNVKTFFRKLMFANVFDIMVSSMLSMEYVISLENCKKAGVVISPKLFGASWFEFFKAEELIRRGEEEAEKLLPKIRELINKP